MNFSICIKSLVYVRENDSIFILHFQIAINDCTILIPFDWSRSRSIALTEPAIRLRSSYSCMPAFMNGSQQHGAAGAADQILAHFKSILSLLNEIQTLWIAHIESAGRGNLIHSRGQSSEIHVADCPTAVHKLATSLTTAPCMMSRSMRSTQA